VLTSERQDRQLQARYRRVFNFADLLDESIQVYRQHWVTFAMVSALCLLPPGLFTVWLGASGALDPTRLLNTVRVGGTPSLDSVVPLASAVAATAVVGVLFFYAWSIAIVATTDVFLHAADAHLPEVFGRTLRRYVPALLGACLWLLGVLALAVVSVLSFFIWPVVLVGILISIVGIVFWWLRPSVRGTWLKWLIIVTTPFGLPTYFAGVWSMYLPAAVLEGRGPLGSLIRSSELLDRQWFRVAGTLTVAGLIVGVLQYIPTFLVQIPLSIVSATRGQNGFGPMEAAVVAAADIVVQVVFGSVASIVYALLFVDLRNRREGTDIAERLSEIEAREPLLSNG
jgi:hypothetical protein